MQLNLRYYKPEVLITIISLLWGVFLWVFHKLWGYGLLLGTGPSAIVVGFLTIYDRWLWKFPVFNWMNTIPDLNGIYTGVIEYHYNGQKSSKQCTLEVKQTCSIIKVKSSFNKDSENETQSVSTEAFIKTDEAGDQYVYFYYHNQGSCQNGDSLDSHDGMNVLEILKDKKNIELKGYYFTNRKSQTKGCMKVTKRLLKEEINGYE